MKTSSDLYIASCVERGGIVRYRLDADGTLTCFDRLDLPYPSYMQIEGNRMDIVLHRTEQGPEGAALQATILPDGSLMQSGARISTRGTSSCHIAQADGQVYCANYSSGSVIRLPDRLVTHSGHGPNPDRQASAHCHCTLFSPDRKYLLVCDLGLDTVFVYDRDLREVSRASVLPGEGCRHAVFSSDGRYLYVENELSGSVSVFSWEPGRLSFIRSVPTLPAGFDKPNKGSAIKLSRDGRFLYVTNRGENTIVKLAVSGDSVSVLEKTPTYGDEPRDFSLLLDEQYAIVTNQFSDCFVLYQVTPAGLEKLCSVPLPAPLCVVEA